MAALAIPIVLLGSIYILSEQEKKDTHKQNNITDKNLRREFFTDNNLNEGYTNYNDANIVDLIATNNSNNEPVNNFGGRNTSLPKYIVFVEFQIVWAAVTEDEAWKLTVFPSSPS